MCSFFCKPPEAIAKSKVSICYDFPWKNRQKVMFCGFTIGISLAEFQGMDVCFRQTFPASNKRAKKECLVFATNLLEFFGCPKLQGLKRFPVLLTYIFQMGWSNNYQIRCICKCLTSMAQNRMSQGTSKRHKNKNWLGGGFRYFLCSPLFGEDSHFDYYFSDGLKPPTSWVFLVLCQGSLNGTHFVESSKKTT